MIGIAQPAPAMPGLDENLAELALDQGEGMPLRVEVLYAQGRKPV